MEAGGAPAALLEIVGGFEQGCVILSLGTSIFVAGSSQAGGVVAVDSGLSAIQHKGLPGAAAPAIFRMVNPSKIVMQGLL